jgi:hypothetical protein
MRFGGWRETDKMKEGWLRRKRPPIEFITERSLKWDDFLVEEIVGGESLRGIRSLCDYTTLNGFYRNEVHMVGDVIFYLKENFQVISPGEIKLVYGGVSDYVYWYPLQTEPGIRFDTIHSRSKPDGVIRGPIELMGTLNEVRIYHALTEYRVRFRQSEV